MSGTITLLLTAIFTLFVPNKHPLLQNSVQDQTTVQADVTVTPSETPTVMPSETPTVTPEATPSVTPSVTPVASPSPSEEPKGFSHGKKKGFLNGLPFGFFIREMAHERAGKNEAKENETTEE